MATVDDILNAALTMHDGDTFAAKKQLDYTAKLCEAASRRLELQEAKLEETMNPFRRIENHG
jgi:hypothetical protein